MKIRQIGSRICCCFLIMNLQDFFTEHNKVALAFSGGVDSSFLLYAAMTYGCNVTAYYARAEFQPEFEYEDAIRLADELNARIKILQVSALSDEDVRRNDRKRCYYCKTQIFSQILQAAHEDGYTTIIDGTNASDDVNDRPGMKALEEMQVLSPLRICGLTKSEIRKLSEEAGLFTWNKPSYACLATRIPTGTPITLEALHITEEAEGLLMEMGFRNFRIRKIGSTAKIQVTKDQMQFAIDSREKICDRLKPFYDSITLDLEARSDE